MTIQKYSNVKLSDIIKSYKDNNKNIKDVQFPFNTKINGQPFFAGITFRRPTNSVYLYISSGYVHQNDNLTLGNDGYYEFIAKSHSTQYTKRLDHLAHTLWINPFIKSVTKILENDYNDNAVHMTDYTNKLKADNTNIKHTLASLGTAPKADLWNQAKINKFLQEYDVTEE